MQFVYLREKKGYTQQEIADVYGCSKQIIYRIMKAMGENARKCGFAKEDAEMMYQMYVNGMSMNDIADRFNSCRHTIGRVLKRYGYKIDRLKYHTEMLSTRRDSKGAE